MINLGEDLTGEEEDKMIREVDVAVSHQRVMRSL